MTACASQAGLIAANSALAVDPDNGQLQKDLRYVEAAAKLWGAVKQAGDPAWAPALERYAKELEVRRCMDVLQSGGVVRTRLLRHSEYSRHGFMRQHARRAAVASVHTSRARHLPQWPLLLASSLCCCRALLLTTPLMRTHLPWPLRHG